MTFDDVSVLNMGGAEDGGGGEGGGGGILESFFDNVIKWLEGRGWRISPPVRLLLTPPLTPPLTPTD